MNKKFVSILSTIIIITSLTAGQVPEFNSQRAFKHLQKQCSFGPRTPGSKAHKLCQDYIVTHLKKCSADVSLQPFPFKNPITGKTYILNNIIARFGKGTDRILLCAHWDTRPWADMDDKKENRNKGVPGANDGASGTGTLLEIASIFRQNPPPVGVDLVFFDGEDSGSYGDNNSWCQGSQYFAKNLGPVNYKYAILLDFVGDKDLHFPVEYFSNQFSKNLVDMVWSKAEQLGLYPFDRTLGPQVIDDHMPLIKAGIPALDIIDFEYQYYHTVNDTPDKCSPESLGIVGTLLLHLIYE